MPELPDQCQYCRGFAGVIAGIAGVVTDFSGLRCILFLSDYFRFTSDFSGLFPESFPAFPGCHCVLGSISGNVGMMPVMPE